MCSAACTPIGFAECNTRACRYYEYTLLSTAEDGSLVEDKTKTLFHILPSPGTVPYLTRIYIRCPAFSRISFSHLQTSVRRD